MSSVTEITQSLGKHQSLTTEERLDMLQDLRETIESGYTSLSMIQAKYGVSRPTAVAWRKAALTLIKNDDQGLDRATIKRMQVGRLQVQIESLQADLKSTTDIKERMLIHQRINAYYETLHRITGLNSETLQVEHQLKPLQINMPNIVEGQVVDSPPNRLNDQTKPQTD